MNQKLVIIPTYNESENITRIIQDVLQLDMHIDLLIVDDNSPDGTAQQVISLQKNYPGRLHLLQRPEKLGLGTAYILGFKWALQREYRFVCEMDADFSHNPKDLNALFDQCQNHGADLAIGSRYISGVNVVNWPMSRVLISYFASMYVRIVTGMNIKDATAGFVCYRSRVLKTIDLDKIRFKGYAFQIEMKFKAWKYKFSLTEVPIIFTDRKHGSSKMNGRIVSEAIFGVIRLKVCSWFTRYNRKA